MKRPWKKGIAVWLLVMIVLSMTACSQTGGEQPVETTALVTTVKETTKKAESITVTDAEPVQTDSVVP
ncbi:MAG TPA: hypothetical protein DDZ89_05560, partial [Clostridiales bacterium]|nr:hypothetical protein [Clostridiales bacterium]